MRRLTRVGRPATPSVTSTRIGTALMWEGPSVLCAVTTHCRLALMRGAGRSDGMLAVPPEHSSDTG